MSNEPNTTVQKEQQVTPPLWFKRKRYGWGWTPATWQGRVITLVYLFLVAGFSLTVNDSSSSQKILFMFVVPVVLLTSIFIGIAYKKGERPRWQWGTPKE